MRNAISHRSRQKGAALLAMVIIFIMASSYAFITKLNANTRDYSRRGSNLSVLNEAKAALIGYAVNYPLDHAGRGPGHLPCADIDNDGTADAPCALAGPVNFTYGRFPWASLFLKTGDLRDASGETLWYAVADNYRSNVAVGPNSDTIGNFSVDGNNDIVAVIFAPGAPLPGQDRSGGPLNVANYLEDSNAIMDVNFATRSVNNFNDTLVTITRQELMAAVEKRVLGDVDAALVNYQSDPDIDDVAGVDPECGADPCDNAFPWLSPFSDPSNSAFRGSLNTVQGHLPFHWSADPNSINQGGAVAGLNPFISQSDILLDWDITSGSITTLINDTWDLPQPACVDSTNCATPNYTMDTSPLLISNASVTWTDNDSFIWNGTVNVSEVVPATTVTGSAFGIGINQWVRANGRWYLGNPTFTGVGTHNIYEYRIDRTYDINITVTGTGTAILPDAGNLRTRTVNLNNGPLDTGSTNSIDITITDVETVRGDNGVGVMFDWWTSFDTTSRQIVSDVATTGTINVSGIQYDLDIDNDELPSWFVQNGWHELVYVAYPTIAAEPLPGGVTACIPDLNPVVSTCLTVNINGNQNTDIRAAVFSAGTSLALIGQDRNTAPDEADYFDDDNATLLDEIYKKDKVTTTYNDQTRIISTAP